MIIQLSGKKDFSFFLWLISFKYGTLNQIVNKMSLQEVFYSPKGYIYLIKSTVKQW